MWTGQTWNLRYLCESDGFAQNRPTSFKLISPIFRAGAGGRGDTAEVAVTVALRWASKLSHSTAQLLVAVLFACGQHILSDDVFSS